MLALMFMSFFEVIIAIIFFGIYVFETINIKKRLKYEKTEEVTVYQNIYYKRMLLNLLSDAMFIAFLLSVVGRFTVIPVLEPNVSISYWYMCAAASVKFLNRKMFYK